MPFDSTKPLNDGYLADAPEELRENFRALKDDQIVDAGKLMGLEVGHASGSIAVADGEVVESLNADLLDGHDSAFFSADGHIHDTATDSSDGFMSNADKTKLDGIAVGAEVNQNAFSNVKVGNTTVAADTKTDTLEMAAGTGITLTPDANNDKVTVAVTANTYAPVSHGTHVPGIKSMTAVGNSGWGTNNNYVPDMSVLAFWNGRFNANSSNLSYCNKGAFGDMATKTASDYLLKTGTAADSTKWAGLTYRNSHNTTDTHIPVFSSTNVDYVLKSEISGISASSVAAQGYIQFSSGLLICWGSKANGGTATFAKAFSTVYSIAVGETLTTAMFDRYPWVSYTTTTVTASTYNNATFRYIAVGKV